MVRVRRTSRNASAAGALALTLGLIGAPAIAAPADGEGVATPPVATDQEGSLERSSEAVQDEDEVSQLSNLEDNQQSGIVDDIDSLDEDPNQDIEADEPPAITPLDEEADGSLSIAEARAVAHGEEVTTSGWVTAAYPTGALGTDVGFGFNGFVIQSSDTGGGCDFTGESDAIFVYTNHSSNLAPTPEVGEYVEVTGARGQYYGLEQINVGPASTVADRVEVVEAPVGEEPAAAISCAFPTDEEDRQAIQSMLYVPEGDLVVTNNYPSSPNYGDITLSTTGEPLRQPTDVAPFGSAKYEEVVALNATHSVLLSNGAELGYNFAANRTMTPPYVFPDGRASVGATVTFNEPVIVDYRRDTWKLQPTFPIQTSATGVLSDLPVSFDYARPAVPTAATLNNPDLTVGAFNLENYFPTTGQDWVSKGGVCTFYTDFDGNPTNNNRCDNLTVNGLTTAGPRGAATDAALANQTGKLIAAINQLDASALGVMELENSYKLNFADADSAGDSAKYLVDQLNAASYAGKWDYVSPDVDQLEPYDQQDVMYAGIIYQPAKVTAIEGGNLILSDQSGAGQPFSNARAPFGQAFEPTDGGEPFFLVSNHFKSKSCGADGVDAGEGCFNADRLSQATALAEWATGPALEELQESTGKEITDVVLVGDFNSYTFESPMQAIEAAGFFNVNVVNGEPAGASYNFSGLNGSLDHVFVSTSAADRTTGHAIWDINGSESIFMHYSRYDNIGGGFVQANLGQPWRSSDHSPAIVGFTAGQAASTVDINLLNINDFHGRIQGTLNDAGDALTDSETVRFAGTVEQLRGQFPDGASLFLSNGDNIGASLFASAIQNDVPTIEVMNALGLAATAVGNHEFDQGWEDLQFRIRDLLDGPVLGANVYEKGTETPVLQEYAILEASGLRVAVIGAVSEETPTLVTPTHVEDLDFGDPVDAVNRVVGDLNALPEDQRPHIIVAEYHEGATEDQAAGVTLEGQIAASPVFARIVNETSPDVDVIFNGHTHRTYVWDAPVPGDEGRTRPVVQAGSYGAGIGQVVLTVDPSDGAVVSYTGQFVPVTDTSMDELLDTYPDPLDEVYDIVLAAEQYAYKEGSVAVGELTAPITRAYTNMELDGVYQRTSDSAEDRAGASPLGTLIGNALVSSLGDLPDAPQIGVVNPGGMRTDLIPNEDGEITMDQARAVLPFNNELTIVTMTGEQFITMLEQQWQRTDTGAIPGRPYLQLGLSDNVQYTYSVVEDPDHDGAPAGVITSVMIDGVPIDPTGEYKIGTFAFLSAGGDNFHVFRDAEVTQTGRLDWEGWVAYLNTSLEGEAFAPDFSRAGVLLEGLTAGTLTAGDEVTATMSRTDVFSVGAPANTSATSALVSGSTGEGSVDLGTTTVAGGTTSVTFVVPETTGEAVFTADFSPTGTEVWYPVSIGAGAEVPGDGGDGGEATKPGGKLPTTGASIFAALLLAGLLGGSGIAVKVRRGTKVTEG